MSYFLVSLNWHLLGILSWLTQSWRSNLYRAFCSLTIDYFVPWNFFKVRKEHHFCMLNISNWKKGGSPASFLRKMSLNVKNRSFTSRCPVAMVTIFDPKIISTILRRVGLTIGCKNCSPTVSVDDINDLKPYPIQIQWTGTSHLNWINKKNKGRYEKDSGSCSIVMPHCEFLFVYCLFSFTTPRWTENLHRSYNPITKVSEGLRFKVLFRGVMEV